MARIDLAGVSLNYELSGKVGAPALMLSSSLGTNLSMWTPQLACFEEHFRVLRYDMRGHGASSVPIGPYSIDQFGCDVLGLLDALELEKVNFCGLSIGGAIGQWLGIHAGSRLHSLVLCNTAARLGSTEIWNQRIADVTDRGMQSIADKVIGRWFTPAFMELESGLVAQMRHNLLASSQAGYVASCFALRDMDLRDAVSTIKNRTCVIAGAYDPVTTLVDAEFLVESIAGAQLVTLPASHISNVEADKAFTETVVGFLS